MSAFPITPILDTFVRADEGPPPSANWTTFSGGLTVLSNQLAGNAAGSNIAFWNVEQLADVEAYLTLPVFVDNVQLHVRLNYGAVSGYVTIFSRTNSEIALLRYDAGVPTPVAVVGGVTFGDGYSIGVRMMSAEYTLWMRDASGGAWLEMARGIDATYTSGHRGISLVNTSTRGSNYGGGTPYIVHPFRTALGAVRWPR